MYDELIKRLRDRAGAFDYDGRPDIACDNEQAADAIEKLSVVVRTQKAVLDKFPRWISVEERLPTVDEGVIVLAFYGSMMRIWSLHRLDQETADVCWECEDGTWEDVCVVTHWMPLPEPPKEDEA